MKKEIKIGDIVKWRCSPFGRKSFVTDGVVIEITSSTFGSIFIIKAVKIKVNKKYRKVFPNRKSTTIAVHNLILE